MIELLLAIPLLSPAPLQTTPDAASEEPSAAEAEALHLRVHAVLHGGDVELRDALVRSGEVWHDSGEFLVGAFDGDTVRALARRGILSIEIGSTTMKGDLWVISEQEIHNLGGKLSPLCTPVLRAPGARLLVLPSGMRPKGAGAQGRVARHTGASLIQRSAWVPGTPFTWQGQTAAGRALTAKGHDPRIQALVDQVSQTNLQAKVVSLSSLYTRRCTRPEAWTARDMIQGWFQSFGLSTSLEWFSGSYPENVVAEITGSVLPDEIIVLGAHYDSINGSGSGYAAPGADDNATGTSGVVEVARILANGGPYVRTIRFIAFSAEELGLYGSGASAQNSRNAGENIVAMINTDMSAYRASGDSRDCDFVT